MNCKKYRACLVAIIAVALICGLFLFVKYGKDSRIPAGGTLVQKMEKMGNELQV